MWKYVTCCLRETLQRGVNYFDARCGAGLANNQSTSVVPRKDNSIKSYQETFRCSGESEEKKTKKNYSDWCYDRVCNPWVNAFTWSGAIVLGWYTTQLLCITQRRRGWVTSSNREETAKECRLRSVLLSNTRVIHSAVLSRFVLAQPPDDVKHHQRAVDSVDETDHNLLRNVVNNNVPKGGSVDLRDDNERIDVAVKDLTDVLSSVENRLGLVAIEGGDLQEGLDLLSSAAQRNHAPALYNLAICYEKGLGMKPDEKMAADLYLAAANLDHPAAIYNLAIFHGQGRGGLARDPLLADRLLRLAASKGQRDAIRVLGAIQPTRSPPPPTSEANNVNNDKRFDLKSISRSQSVEEEKFEKKVYSPTEVFLNIIAGNDMGKHFQENRQVVIA